MKRILSLLLAAAMLLSLCACKKSVGGNSDRQQLQLNYPKYADAESYSAADNAAKYSGKEPWQPMTWTLVCDVRGSSTATEAARYFNALMQHSTDGRVSVKVSTTHEGEDAVQKLMYGDEVQLSIQSSLAYAAFDPRLGAASLPFLFPSLETAEETLNGRAGKQLKELLPQLGMTCIGIGSYGFHELLTGRGPVTRPDDLSGMTISVVSDIQADHTAKLMSATVLTPEEVATQTFGQAANGICAPISDLPTQQSRKRYLSLWNFSYEPVFFCINQNVYSQLTDEQKKVVIDNGTKAATYQRHLQRNRNAERLDAWREDGMVEVTDYESMDITALKAATADVEEHYRQRLVTEVGMKDEQAQDFVAYFHIE